MSNVQQDDGLKVSQKANCHLSRWRIRPIHRDEFKDLPIKKGHRSVPIFVLVTLDYMKPNFLFAASTHFCFAPAFM